MIKKSFLKAILICLILVSGQQLTSYAQKVNIIATPATARIYVDGRIKGTGSYTVSVGKKDCVTVEVRDEGYLPEVRTYCNKRGYDDPPKMDNIQLKQDETLLPSSVSITSSPQTAKIFVNGVEMGSGSHQLSVPLNECLTVEVRAEGFIQESRTYCKKKGQGAPPKSDYFKLQQDESYTSSIESDIANKELILNVKSERNKEEAWKIIVATVLGKFDVLEMNDEKSGYLRTAWVGKPFAANTVRMRVIVKQATDDPLTYKIKFISEASGSPRTPYSADEQFDPIGRILKTYDGFLDELITKLKN
ncbi:MAG: hypothetical protein IPO01_12625 [Chitinophagaceae bacterium]|nr:hypothetical protein [Chitinophagaceae bacterium]MBK7306493.1 hypothetical protein [Chitinophagaceae bacterium]MBK8787504.1 hypothetical protein [Chitinophagaceae bacterium]MBK9486008.1 hypothetical protein [Chitinophagaceae bacterium]MBL0201476.1 hypothetical protein [Chitinophagaceae bacterium]